MSEKVCPSDADRLYDLIAHGDEQHRSWLRAKCDEFFAAPPPAAPDELVQKLRHARAMLLATGCSPTLPFGGSLYMQAADALTAQAAELASERAKVAKLQAVVDAADRDLSRILHEMAGAVSLCWEPKPTGVFASTLACEFVAATIAEIRAALKDAKP